MYLQVLWIGVGIFTSKKNDDEVQCIGTSLRSLSMLPMKHPPSPLYKILIEHSTFLSLGPINKRKPLVVPLGWFRWVINDLPCLKRAPLISLDPNAQCK